MPVTVWKTTSISRTWPPTGSSMTRRPFLGRLIRTGKTEQEVFTLLAEKKEPSEIARILGKKEKTVQNQKSIIYQKLSIRDRLELVEFAKNIGVLV